MAVGIEAINAYTGQAYIDVKELFIARQLDLRRFDNLMMHQKTVGIPCEDSVTMGVNAAKPIVDQLSDQDKQKIEMVIAATETGLDFGKAISTYMHEHLGLGKHCRLFEVKQACYAATASLQMAINFVASEVSPGAKVLVISTDTARAAMKLSYAEPSQGAAAIAMLVSNKPDILEVDFGANGYYGYEVMDTCRPQPEIETGDADLSLMSYINCLENSFQHYASKVADTDYRTSFDYLIKHTPFGGLVKGAHRHVMHKLYKEETASIDADFAKRVTPSLTYNIRVGNVYSASVYLALCSLIDSATIDGPKRVGIYSYGSGCSSEFYSGLITPASKQALQTMHIAQALENRFYLTIERYDHMLEQLREWMFGIENKHVDVAAFQDIYDKQFAGKGLLVLKAVKDYHREYDWS